MDRRVTAPIGRAALIMSAATFASRVAGFGRVLVIAAILGASGLGDAFQGSNSFSNVLFELLAAGALSAVLVPTFVRLCERGDDELAERLAGGLLWWAVVGLGSVAVVGVLAAPWLARLLTAGVEHDVAAHRELVTYLLRWFIPQVVLYAFGALATAGLYARRRFAVTAMAPMANTLVVVLSLVAFRAAVGSDPGFDLSSAQRALLGIAGTGGVLGFVGVLVAASWRAGFRLVPRRVGRADAEFRAILRHSGWGIALQSIVGLLLGAAVILGGSVRGGVVAYQAAFVFFLAPYAILAQPLQTAALPALSLLGSNDAGAFVARLRWVVQGIAHLVLPASALMIAVAGPALDAVRVGEIDTRGAALIAAAIVGLLAGLLPYSAFLLFARASYALDDSRAPALIALAAGAFGVAVMAVAAGSTDGSDRIAALGFGHSAAYGLGAVILARRLRRRLGAGVVGGSLIVPAIASSVAGVVAAAVVRVGDVADRLARVGLVAIALAVGISAYLAVMRASRTPLRPRLGTQV